TATTPSTLVLVPFLISVLTLSFFVSGIISCATAILIPSKAKAKNRAILLFINFILIVFNRVIRYFFLELLYYLQFPIIYYQLLQSWPYIFKWRNLIPLQHLSHFYYIHIGRIRVLV